MNNSALKREIGPCNIESGVLKARVKEITSRSLKKESKVRVISEIISFLDMTTLEGSDTPNKVYQLVEKAAKPHPINKDLSCAAVCVYSDMVPYARAAIDKGGYKLELASVSSYFPSGRSDLEIKLLDSKNALIAGATEIDIVIDRGAFLKGDFYKVYTEIKELVSLAHSYNAKVKTILEVGELPLYSDVSKASKLAIIAGSDFIKTSTGKLTTSSTPEYAYIMSKAISEYSSDNFISGFKPAGGIKSSKDAFALYLVVLDVLGYDFMKPELFRMGASTLLSDLLLQYEKQVSANQGYKSNKYLGAI